jgi:hypothetical protein
MTDGEVLKKVSEPLRDAPDIFFQAAERQRLTSITCGTLRPEQMFKETIRSRTSRCGLAAALLP